VARVQSQLDEAEARYVKALALSREGHDALGIGNSLVGLGRTALARSQGKAALGLFRQALGVHEPTGVPDNIALARDGLARAHFMLGHWQAAEEQAREALRIRERIGVPEVEQSRALLAEIESKLRQSGGDA